MIEKSYGRFLPSGEDEQLGLLMGDSPSGSIDPARQARGETVNPRAKVDGSAKNP
jgi:hypothetical protein